MVTENDIKMAIAVFGGLTTLLGAAFGAARLSRCTHIRTPCCECERSVPGDTTREGAEAQV